MIDIPSMIKGYINYYKSDFKDEEAQELAWQLEDYIENNPKLAIQIISDLINLCDSQELLYYIAAGPLENFVNKYGPDFESDLAIISRQNPDFRKALLGVYPSKTLGEDFIPKLIGIS